MKSQKILYSKGNNDLCYTPDYGVMLLSIVIATIPSIIVFFALQKYFVAGLSGAVK